MDTSLQALIESPDFYKLPVPDRKARLSAASTSFRALPPQEQDVAVQSLEQRWRAGIASAPGQPAVPPSGGGLPDLKDVSLGFRTGAADLAHSTGNALDLIPGLDSWAKKAKETAQSWAPTETEQQGREGIAHQVVQGVAGAPAAIVKYAPALALKRFSPVGAAVIGAVSASDKSGKEIAEAAAQDAFSFWAMNRAGSIRNRAGRAAASAAAAAAPTAVASGGDPKATAAAAILGGTFGAIQPPTPPQASNIPERVKPAVKSLADDFQAALSPGSRGETAKQTITITRAKLGGMKQKLFQVNEELADYREKFEKQLDKGKRNEVFDALDKIETGNTAQLAPDDLAFAQASRRLLDEQYQELNRRGLLDTYIEDYFPRLWKRNDNAAQLYEVLGKRPFQGPKGFSKQRTFATIKEGVQYAEQHPELGLKLVSENPVDLLFLKVREGQRAILAHDVMQEMRQAGLLKFSRNPTPPAGYAEIKDRAFRKMFKKDGTWSTAGYYYAPEPAARVIKNYLDPGLRDRPWFRGYQDLANSMNQFQLGFSFFHLGFSTLDAATHSVSLGVEKIVHGLRTGAPKTIASGAGEIAKAPFVALEPFVPGWRKTGLTNQVWEEYAKPGSHPQYAPLAQAMKDAGFQVALDPFYKTEFKRKLRIAMRSGDYLGAAFYGSNRLGEFFSRFLMEYAVPRQKVGGFARMAEFELSRLPANATQEQIRQTMQKVSDSVENRLGQIAYDNLFWNKTAKDLLMASVRSVGWNFGTFRELLGGAKDWSKATIDALTPGKRAEFTHRMAYTVSLPALVGTLGAVTNYMMTGEYPQSLRDYFFPRTGLKDEYGRDERISFPSYIKDVYHYGAPFVHGGLTEGIKGAAKTTQAKLHPAVTAVAEWMENEDWQSVKIRNEDDPAMRQIIDSALYFGKQFIPFSFKYFVEDIERTAEGRPTRYTMPGRLRAFIGITPAPADLKKSETEIFVNRFVSEKMPRGSRTRTEADRQKAVTDMEQMVRLDQDVQPYAQKQIEKGRITERDIEKARARAEVSPVVRKFRQLPWRTALQAYEIAVHDGMVPPADRQQMHEMLVDKIGNALDEIAVLGQGTPDQRRALDTIVRLNLATREELKAETR